MSRITKNQKKKMRELNKKDGEFVSIGNRVLEKIPDSAFDEMMQYINELRAIEIPNKQKIIKLGIKGIQLNHKHLKHKVDKFNYCDQCDLLFINGEPRKPILTSEYKKEVMDCSECFELFKRASKSGKTKKETFTEWEKHFNTVHPQLYKWNLEHNLDLSKVDVKVIPNSKGGHNLKMEIRSNAISTDGEVWNESTEEQKLEALKVFANKKANKKIKDSKNILEKLYEEEVPRVVLPDKRVPIRQRSLDPSDKYSTNRADDLQFYRSWKDFPKDGIPSCNNGDCTGHEKAVYWFELMYRMGFRCEEHKDNVISRTISSGKIDDAGNWRKQIGDVDKRFEDRARENGIKDFNKFTSLTTDFNINVVTWKPKEYEKWKKQVESCIDQDNFTSKIEEFDQVYIRVNQFMTEKAKYLIPYLDKFGDLTTKQTEELYFAFRNLVKEFDDATQMSGEGGYPVDEQKSVFYKEEITFDELGFLDKYGFDMKEKYFILNQSPSRIDFYEQLMYYLADKNDRQVRVDVEEQINQLIKVCPECKKIVYNADISDTESKKQFDEHVAKDHKQLAENIDFENLSFGTFRDEIQKIVSSFLPLNCGFNQYTTETVSDVFKDFLTFWYYEKAPIVQNATLKNVIMEKLTEYGTVIKNDLELAKNPDEIISYMINKTNERAKKLEANDDLPTTNLKGSESELEHLDLTPLSKLLTELKPDIVSPEVFPEEPDEPDEPKLPILPVSTPPPDKPKKISIHEFRRIAPSWNIKSIEDWKRFTNSAMFPDNIPVNPHIAYKQDWRGYPKEFAYEKIKRKLTVEEIERIVKTFGERWLDYKHFPDALILDWFSTFDLFNVDDPFWKVLFKNFRSWRQDPEGIASIRYWFATGDLKKEFGKYSCIPKVRETKEDYLDRTQTRLDDVKQLELLSDERPIGVTGVMLNTEHVVPNKVTDPKWYNMHVLFRKKQIWENLFDEDSFEKELRLLKTYKKGVNEFRDDVLDGFWKEYDAVINFNYAKEFYKFKFPPKLIQLYGAYRMKWESGFFNMASTGDYKTGQAIISAIASNSTNCLAIVPATIVDQWIRNIRLFYPHCQVTSGKEIPESFFINHGFHTNFHVISYGLWQLKKSAENLLEQFNGKAIIYQKVEKLLKTGKKKSKMIHQSIPKTIDFIVLDESHFVKQRFEDSEESDFNKKSNRRMYIQQLLEQERKKNRKVKGLFLSATPSINNVQEAKSLLEMLTGVKYDSIHNYSNIRNAVKCYTEFLPVSLSHVKIYNIKTKGKDKPITVEGFIPDYYTDEQIRKLSYLELDQIATKYRIPKIIELLKQCKGKSVIYSYYRTGVVNQIQDALSKEINPETGNPYKVGLFTGTEKSGMVRKTGKKDNDGNEIIENPFLLGEIDVLIATRTFGVGFDGVQEVCNNIFFNGFVFTYGDFEQITGRLIRSGQFSDTVNVFLVFAKLNGVAFDYELKYLRVKAKKSLGDCIKNGTLPKRISLARKDKQRKKSLDKMLKNKISGFPTKEKVERELESEAIKELDQKVATYFTEIESIERMKRE